MNNGHATPHHNQRILNRNQNAMNGGVSSKRFPIENEMKRIYYSNNLSIWAFRAGCRRSFFFLFNPLKEVCAVEKRSHYTSTPERASEAHRKKRREMATKKIGKQEEMKWWRREETQIWTAKETKKFGSNASEERRLLWIVAVELIVMCDHCDAAHIWRSTIHFFERKVDSNRRGKKNWKKRRSGQ